MVATTDVETVLECYVRIYFACHLRQMEGNRKGGEVSAHQLGILNQIRQDEGTTVLELARQVGVAASTMSLTLDRLERGGYVRRVKDSNDGRRTLIQLTADGRRAREKQQVLEPERIKAMLERLSMPKRKEALAGLKLLRQAAAEMAESGTARMRRAG
jgi:DNA-binding MarR family transcriptional regulator